MMDNLKRKFGLPDEVDFDCHLKQHANSGDFDNLPDASTLSWSEMWAEILGQTQDGANESHEHNSEDVETFAQDDCTAQTLGDSATGELFSIGDVSLCIQKWADACVAPSVSSAAQMVSDEQHHQNLTAGFINHQTVKCFGMIYETSARLMGEMSKLRFTLTAVASENKTYSVLLRLQEDFIALVDKDGALLGQLNDALTSPLRQLFKLPSFAAEAFMDIRNTVKCIDRARRLNDSVIKVDINVYGKPEIREELSQILSAEKIYLQHTQYRQADFEYENPHMLSFEGVNLDRALSTFDAEPEDSVTPATVQETVMNICQAETQNRHLKGVEHDARVKSMPLAHQSQALEFMVQQELGLMPLESHLWELYSDGDHVEYRHRITGCRALNACPPVRGGILADDMGMGKSLSTLSLIVQRLSEGDLWSQTHSEKTSSDVCTKMRSRATLIVVSSLLIMNGWFKEIADHLDGSVKTIKYHGKRRKIKVPEMVDSDIVLTTYHTLAAERKGKKGLLSQIEWFRIVLDEAHTVRRQTTSLFAAVSELDAYNRWCLTGTPIQNTLEDLGALLAFLRFHPCDKTSIFRRHIIAPFSEDLEEGRRRLMLLLTSISLRRRITRLNLQPLDERVHYVELTTAERRFYEKTLTSMAYAMTHGSRERIADTPFGKFQIQLQLRILCNHGTFQRPFAWGLRDVQVQREDAMASMGKNGEILCSNCQQKVSILETNCTADERSQGSHGILCNECIAQTSETPSQASCNAGRTCVGEASETFDQRPVRFLSSRKHTFDESGYSAKMNALVDHVTCELLTTKSIIFSSWTRSLNLVALHLDWRQISFARIDGDTEILHRQKILDEFSRDDRVRVLLMTTGTGAYGLNLAVANRVFILEPQWNPSIENQAIARVQRFLQERSVQVTRYVTRGTVEEDIRRQQSRKNMIAEIGFQSK